MEHHGICRVVHVTSAQCPGTAWRPPLRTRFEKWDASRSTKFVKSRNLISWEHALLIGWGFLFQRNALPSSLERMCDAHKSRRPTTQSCDYATTRTICFSRYPNLLSGTTVCSYRWLFSVLASWFLQVFWPLRTTSGLSALRNNMDDC